MISSFRHHQWLLVLLLWSSGMVGIADEKILAQSNCTFTDTTDITDGGVTNLSLTINGALNNNLANPGQGVCGVVLHFKHQFICDLTMELISPAGQVVSLVGSSDNTCNPTNATWLVTFVPCNHPEWTQADPNISATTWSNTLGWSTGLYTGAYFPVNGNCLEEFNTGTVNGTWTLRILDADFFYTGVLYDYTILFCDDSGLDCSTCEAQAGDLSAYPDVTACAGNPALRLQLPPVYAADTRPDSLRYGYQYVVAEGGVITNYVNTPNLRNYPPGQYTVCGLSYRLTDIGKIPDPNGSITVNALRTNLAGGNPLFCGRISTDCIEVTILPAIDTLFITDTLCYGECLRVSDTTLCQSGAYTITRGASVNCDSVFRVQLYIRPAVSTTLQANLCNNECITVGNNTYCAAGSFIDTLQNQHGCDSLIFTTVQKLQALAVAPPTDRRTCSDTLRVLSGAGSSVGATVSYRWNTVNSGVIVGDSTLQDVTINAAGIYRLIVTQTDLGYSCSDTAFSVVTNQFNPPTVAAQGGDITCDQPAIPLMFVTNAAAPTVLWQSANGFSSTDLMPSVMAGGTYTVIVTDAFGCKDSAFAVVTVDTLAPIATAIGDTLTCLPNQINQLRGNSSSLPATFSWSGPNGFLSALENPMVSAAGSYQLIVTLPNGCSDTAQAEVIADANLPQFSVQTDTLTCTATSVQLQLNPQMPTTTYQWSGPNGFSSSLEDPFATRAGLYTVTVTATNNCTATQQLLVPIDTLSPVVQILPPDTLTCLQTAVTLSATVQNATPLLFNWTAANGTLVSPTVTTAGNYYLAVQAANGCIGRDTAQVVADTLPPPVSATVMESLTCDTDTVYANWNGVLLSTYTYQWTGPNGFAADSYTPPLTVAGNYTVAITAANGCTTQLPIVVGIDTLRPVFNIVATPTTHLTCDTNIIRLLASPTFTDYIYRWTLPTQALFVAQSLQVGTEGWYVLQTTAPNGCSQTDSLLITADDAVPYIFTNGNILTCETDSVQIFVGANPPDPTLAYHWEGPGGVVFDTQNPFVVQQGTYYVTATATNGCEAISIAEVTKEDVVPSVQTQGDTLICTQNLAQIAVSTDAAGAVFYWYTPAGVFFSNSANPVVTAAGLYKVVVEVNDCQAIGYANVPQINVLPDLLTQSDTLTCTDTLGTLLATSTTAPIGYEWRNIANTFLGTSATWTTSVAGDYIVIATNEYGCTRSDTVSLVANNTLPMIAIIGDTLTCTQLAIDLVAAVNSTPLQVQWYDGTNTLLSQNDTLFNVQTADTYTVSVTGENFCTNSATYRVIADTLAPLASATANDTLTCSDPSVTAIGFSPTAGVTYHWTGVNSYDSVSQIVTLTQSGLYILSVTAPNGCIGLDSVWVAADADFPVLGITADTLDCATPSVTLTLTSSLPLDSIAWSANGNVVSQSAQFTTAQGGDFALFVRATNGCELTSMATVVTDTLPPLLFVLSDTLTCAQTSVSLLASADRVGTLFQWEDAMGTTLHNGSTLTVTQAATYSVIATAPNQCTATQAVTVLQNDTLPELSLTTDTITCAQPMATLSISSTPVATYEWWTLSGNLLSTAATFMTSQVATYRLQATLPNGCKSDTVFAISSILTPPLLTAIGDTLTCLDTVGILQAQANEPVNFTWYYNNSVVSQQAVDTFAVSGLYKVVATNAWGCADTLALYLLTDTLPPALHLTASLLTCRTDSTQLQVSPLLTTLEYVWQSTDGFISQLPQPTVRTAATYFLQATAPNGCMAFDTLVVRSNQELPYVEAGAAQVIDCTSNTAQLQGSINEAGTYVWTTTNGTINGGAQTLTPRVSSAAWYYLTLEAADNGCVATDSVQVIALQNILQAPQLGLTAPSCYGVQDGQIRIEGAGGTPPYEYALNNNQFFTTVNAFGYLAAGEYLVTVRDQNGCLWDTLLQLPQPPALQVDLGEDRTIALGSTTLLQAQTNTALADLTLTSWTPAENLSCDFCLSQNVSPSQTTRYTLHLTDVNGCTVSDDVLIRVEKATQGIFIPTVFTPNGDGFNDILMIFGGAAVRKIHNFTVFSRWGEMVYTATDFLPNDPQYGWNGMLHGSPMNPAVFVYTAEIEWQDGRRERLQGDFTLVR